MFNVFDHMHVLEINSIQDLPNLLSISFYYVLLKYT